MPEKQENTISESLKLTGTIYRILKDQKTISLAKAAMTKQIRFNRSFML